MLQTNLSTDTSDREIVIERVLNASPELVFDAWTQPEHVAKWWGPDGFTITTHEMEVIDGGIWRFIMHGPDGTDYPNKIVFVEVLKPERLVYMHMEDNAEASSDNAFKTTVTFEAQGNKTLLTMRSVFDTKEARDFAVREFGAIEGGKQTINRLEAFLAKM